MNHPQKIGAVTKSGPKNRLSLLAAIAMVVVAAAAAGGFLWLRYAKPAPASAIPVAQTKSGSAEKKAAGVPVSTPKPSPEVVAGTPTAAGAPPTSPPQTEAAVAFDPRKLNPKQNTRLKFGTDHVPANMSLTVDMDGKLFFKGPVADKAGYDDLYVPPGVHEFQVAVSAGSVKKVSNMASADFLAKKHMTLKISLRPKPARNATTLDPATQVVASLKTDFFPF